MACHRVQLILVMLACSRWVLPIGALGTESTAEAAQSSGGSSSISSSSSPDIDASSQTDAGWTISHGTATLASATSVNSTAAGRTVQLENISAGSVIATNASTSATETQQLPQSSSAATDVAPIDATGTAGQQLLAESPAISSMVPAVDTAAVTGSLASSSLAPAVDTAPVTRSPASSSSAPAVDTAAVTGSPVSSSLAPAADTAAAAAASSLQATEKLLPVTTTGSTAAAANSSNSSSDSGSGRDTTEAVTTVAVTEAAASTANVTAVMPRHDLGGSWIVFIFVILAMLLAAAAIISCVAMLLKWRAGRNARAAKRRWNANSAGTSYAHMHAKPAVTHGMNSVAAAQAFYIGPSALTDESPDGPRGDGSKGSAPPPPYNEQSAHPDRDACLGSPPAATSDVGQQMSTFLRPTACATGEGATFPPSEHDGILNISFRASEDGIARTAL